MKAIQHKLDTYNDYCSICPECLVKALKKLLKYDYYGWLDRANTVICITPMIMTKQKYAID